MDHSGQINDLLDHVGLSLKVFNFSRNLFYSHLVFAYVTPLLKGWIIPAVDKFVTLNQNSFGRDLMGRIVQNVCVLTVYYMKQVRYRKRSIKTLQNINQNLYKYRKILGFGRAIDLFYDTIYYKHEVEDKIPLYLVLSARFALGVSLTIDHLICLKLLGLVNFRKDFLKNTTHYLRLSSASLRFIRDLYELYVIYLSRWIMFHPKLVVRELNTCICIDCVKNILDLLTFLRKLQYVRHSEFFLGILTLIGTVIYIVLIVWPDYRLQPH